MDSLRHLLPTDSLSRARVAATVLACLSLATQLPQAGNAGQRHTINVAAVGALIVLGAILIVVLRRGATPWWEPFTVPPLILLAGAGQRSALNTVGVALAVVAALAFFGSLPAFVARSVGGLAAIPAAAAWSPIADGRILSWNSAETLSIMPRMAMTVLLTRAVYIVLVRQHRARLRDRVLAQAGSRLLSARDAESALAIGTAAVDDLLALSPGMAGFTVRQHGPGFEIISSTGVAKSQIGMMLDPAVRTDPQLLRELAPTAAWWIVEEFAGDHLLIVGAEHRIVDDVLDPIRTLARQVTLAVSSCLSHAELDHQANHDTLTELPNRAQFFRRLAAAVDAGTPESVALLNIDLDDFKQVNDLHGHKAGDAVLVEVARRLATAGGPSSVPARLGGDEFMLLIAGLDDPQDAERIAHRTLKLILEPIQSDGNTLQVGASVGVALATVGMTAGDLMRCADIAMYSAKARGKNRFERFDSHHHGDIAYHRTLDDQLPSAFDRDEIALRYQPYVDVNDTRWGGAQCSAHWEHPTLGLIDQETLAAVAARTGHSMILTEHILYTIRQHIVDHDIQRLCPALKVEITMSVHQILDPRAAEAIAATGMPPAQLAVRVTQPHEPDHRSMAKQLRSLTDLGVTVVLDDDVIDGLPLAVIRELPITMIRLNPGRLVRHDDNTMLLTVARMIGVQTLVAAVETFDDLDRLRPLQVDAIQGSLLAPPMPIADLAARLATHPPKLPNRTSAPSTEDADSIA